VAPPEGVGRVGVWILTLGPGAFLTACPHVRALALEPHKMRTTQPRTPTVTVGRRADLGVLAPAAVPGATGVCGGGAIPDGAGVDWPLLVEALEACRDRVCTGVESAEIGAGRIADRCSM
jgi:hypothetical protein